MPVFKWASSMNVVIIFAIAAGFYTNDAQSTVPPGERAVKPYEQSNENAGAKPMLDRAIFDAFGGMPGIAMLSDQFITRLETDSRTREIMIGSDPVRLRRTIAEQFCYVLGGGCTYTGMDMKKAHADHGINKREFLVTVELLRDEMIKLNIPTSAQNKFLAKLAPMHRDVVQR